MIGDGEEMQEARAFALLGLQPIKDEDKIKAAYRKKLPSVNPEDDPQGFQQLREAYETALAYAARTEEKEEESADNTPSGLFVQKVDALYRSLQGRQDVDAWEALFREPVFLDLEEDERCKEKLVVYLMNHYYLPTGVWRAIGKALCIEEEKQKLYEKFPKDFIDHIARKAAQGEEFEFEQLEGKDDADLESWIHLYSRAGQEENEKNYEALAQTLRQAKEIGITHPGLSFMEARLLLATGRQEQGDRIVEGLMQGPFAERLNVRYQSAEYFWSSGRREQAAPLYGLIRQEDHRHYMANKRLGQWYLEQGNYEEAKKCVNVLLAYPLNEEVEALVEQVNRELEVCLRQKLEEDPRDLRARMDLGWCLLQDDRIQEALELMRGCTVPDGLEKDYANLMCKVYYYSHQYEQAVPLIRRWIELLQEQMPQEEQERQADCERIATGHSMLSAIEVERAREQEGEKRDEAFAQALLELDLAKDSCYNPGQDYNRCQIYLEWEKYRECQTLCEELTAAYPDFAGVVILHQKACAGLYDAAGVIGDYHTLRRLDPEYAGAWELAAEVYYQLKRTEELDELLAEAGQQEVSSGRLHMYGCYRRFDTAETKEDLRRALKEAGEIEAFWETEQWKDAEKAEFLGERARNYWRLEENETALALIERAIGLDGENLRYPYIKAGIKKDQQHFDEALQFYLSCELDYDETPHFYANVGECYYRLGQEEDALGYLKEAVKRKEDNALCCSWIVRILKRRMEEKDSLEQMEEALQYADLMVKYCPESYFYIERGLLFMLAREYERAAEDFCLAVSADETDPYAHSNLSRACQALDRFEEAKKEALRAVELVENSPGTYHYEMLANVCRQTGAYEEALETYLKVWERFPEYRKNYLDDILNMYCRLGRWQEALHFLEDHYQGREKKEGERIKKTLDVYCMAGFYPQALLYLKTHGRLLEYSAGRLAEETAQIYWYQGDLARAGAQIRKALKKQSRDDARFPRVCLLAGHIFFFDGRFSEAASWASEALGYYQRHGGLTKWLNRLDQNLIMVFELGTLKLYAGEVETAYAMAKKLQSNPRCLDCKHGICTDGYELEASVDVARGDYAHAVALYEKILRENAMDQDVRMKLALIKKRAENR